MKKILAILMVILASPMVWASDPASDFVTGLSSKAIGIIESKSMDSEVKEKELTALFKKSVDTEWMAKFVLGRHFQTLPAEKQKRYLELYQSFLVQSYIPKFKKYAGEKFKVLNIKNEQSGEYVVQTELVKTEGQPSVKVDYRIRQAQGGFKVIDIIGEGVSLITTQRSDFAGVISREGMDAFLDKLSTRVASAE